MEVIKRELDEAKGPIGFVMRIYATQVRGHWFFVREHPGKNTSWDMAEVKKVQGTDCLETVQMDMCRFGMTAVDGQVMRSTVQKCTKLMTSPPEAEL